MGVIYREFVVRFSVLCDILWSLTYTRRNGCCHLLNIVLLCEAVLTVLPRLHLNCRNERKLVKKKKKKTFEVCQDTFHISGQETFVLKDFFFAFSAWDGAP